MTPGLLTGITILAAIVCATVAVSLGHIDGQTYAGLVGGALGFGAGVGAHAAGVNSGAAQATASSSPPASSSAA